MPKEIKKAKRKENIRDLILESAKSLLVEVGYQGTSIRKIASKIGYSPTTIYLYYKDKNDIIYTLHQEGFEILRVMFTALINIESPFERLKALGRTYLQFGKENPDFYELMFMMKEPMKFLDESDKQIWEAGTGVFNFIVATIEECQEDGYFSNDPASHIAMQAWGVVHGLCSLFLTTRLKKVGQLNLAEGDSEIVLENAFKSYVNFIEQNKKN